MFTRRGIFAWVLVLAVLAAFAAPASPSPVQAQSSEDWVHVWLFSGDNPDAPTVEYRTAGGTVVAAFTLQDESFRFPRQAGGRLFGFGIDAAPIFDPFAGEIMYRPVQGLQPGTDRITYSFTGEVIPTRDGSTYAYGISRIPADPEGQTTSWIYVARPGRSADELLLQVNLDPFQVLAPQAWSNDGSALFVHHQPLGIGGYILFWTYQDVERLDLQTGTTQPVGAADGWTADLSTAAQVVIGESVALLVTDVATGQTNTYPAPNGLPLDEIRVGGGAYFSPDGTKVAYQVARSNPDREKYWTIVVDRSSGLSQVVLEDESESATEGYLVRYGSIGGWQDNSTLVVGGPGTAQSALIDVETGNLIAEQPGRYLGAAYGVSATAPFAPVQTVQKPTTGMSEGAGSVQQCPDAPVSRLAAGMDARVTFSDGRPVNLRRTPGGTVLRAMPEGTRFTVLSGPTCLDGFAWWEIALENGVTGFAAEGEPGNYYLEPMS